MVYSADDPTYLSLLEIFLAKADGNVTGMRQRLNFTLNLSKDMDKIKTKIVDAGKVFLSPSKREQVLARVPKTIFITADQQRVIAHYLLNKRFVTIYHSTVKIKKITNEILSEIALKPLNQIDEHFDRWYRRWDPNCIDNDHIAKIKENIRSIASVYEQIHGHFMKDMRVVNEVKANLDMLIGLAYSSIERLLNSTVSAKQFYQETELIEERTDLLTVILGDLDPILERIPIQQDLLTRKLIKLNNWLVKYNEKRTIWAEFMIGMDISHLRRTLI